MKSIFTFRQFQKLKTVELFKHSKWAGYLLRPVKALFFTLLFFISSNAFSQTFPSASSCTSKDLSLVAATLPYAKCATCTPGSTVSKPLTLAINNKTGSTRTSFAFWATLIILNANGDTASKTAISGCYGPIPKNATTQFKYKNPNDPIDSNLIFQCGQTLILTNIWEAWTDASPGSTCPTLLGSTSTINPKCGTNPMLNVVAGDDANYTVTNATCTTLGSIQVAPFGGAGGPYTVTISNVNATTIANTQSIAAGGSYTWTNLAPGVYTFGITDGNNCAPVIETRTVASTGSVSAPTITSAPATCSAAGSSTISNYSASNTYAFTPSGPSVGTGGSISGMTVGTSYTVTATNGSCTSTASASFSNAAMLPTPATPTISSGAATCSAAGTSTISNYSVSNTYAFTPSGPSVGAGGLISGMVVGTSYTVTSNNGSCTSPASASFSNAAMLATPATPTISSAPATCSAAGSSTISNYSASNTYAFTPSGPSVGAGGLISGMVVGTSYTVTSNNGNCTSPASASFSNAAMLATPATPTISSTPPTCSAAGSSTISNYSASNTYAFTPSGPSVGAGGLINGMTVGTSYTVTSNNGSCTSPASASFSNAAMLATPATPTISSTPATCSAAGSSTISNYSASNTYAFTPSGPSVGTGGLISGMVAGTSYTVTSNNGSCTSPASASFSNAANLAAPSFTVCIVQPTLCTTGSLAIHATNGTGFSYSIDGSDFSNTTGIFSGLGVGSVTSVQVKNSDGCSSAAVSCDNLVSDCSAPQANVSVIQPSTQISSQTTVKAYPNPFNNDVKFVVTAAKSGNGSLEIFNIMGQKVKTVYQGHVSAGVNNFDLNLPGQKYANLIYRFILDNKLVTGKLIQLNQ